MPWLMSSGAAGGSFGYTGQLWRWRPTSDDLTQSQQITLPTGVNTVDEQGSSVTYRNRHYITGRYTSNLVVDEFFRAHVQGIRPPTAPATIATGAATGITGDVVGYLTFYDEKTGERSPLSGASSSVSFSNQKVSWTSIPTTSPDPRVTHVEFWRSVDGGTIRFVTRRQLGVTSLTEAVATLSLGAAFGTNFERLPRGKVNAIYNQRQCVAGNAQAPDTLYVSALFQPERYESLSFATDKGEPIVGLAAAREVLVAFTPTSMYMLRGYTEADMTFKLIEEGIGAVNHACIRVIRDNIWFVSDNGIYMWNGAPHLMNRDMETVWVDFYAANRALVEKGFGLHSRGDRTYRFYVSDASLSLTDMKVPNPANDTIQTIGWVADYTEVRSEAGGMYSQPSWSWDIMAREIASAAELGLPGTKRYDTYLGFCDGKAYLEDADDNNDASDAYDKMLYIRTKAYHLGSIAGDDERYGGATLTRAWTHILAEDDAWIALFKAGDEETGADGLISNAQTSQSGLWYDSVSASANSDTSWDYVPQTVHPHAPESVSGRTITAEFRVNTPSKTVNWRGWGGYTTPGPAGRPAAAAAGPVE